LLSEPLSLGELVTVIWLLGEQYSC